MRNRRRASIKNSKPRCTRTQFNLQMTTLLSGLDSVAVNRPPQSIRVDLLIGRGPLFGDGARAAGLPATAATSDAATGGLGVRMLNQKSGRSGALSEGLNAQLNAVSAQTGVGFEVTSGGEVPGGYHSGSGRHEHGGAADTKMYVMENGNKRYLSINNSEDRTKIQEVIAESRRSGIKGIGIGPGYMGDSIHLGGGTALGWGAGGRSANMPGWARSAYESPQKYVSTGRPAAVGGDDTARAVDSYEAFRSRQEIDRTQSASTKVEGTGKLTVDVNAPKGTRVAAEGGGLFKKTEVSRQTQMEPAKSGPSPGADQ